MLKGKKTVTQRTAARKIGCGIAWLRLFLKSGILTLDPADPGRAVKDERFAQLENAWKSVQEYQETLEALREVQPMLEEIRAAREAAALLKPRTTSFVPVPA